MSPGDVHDNEMNEPTEVDDAAAEALLAGSGQEVDPALAAAVLAIRGLAAAPPPSPSDEFMQLMGTAPPRSRSGRRTWSWPAKVGAAAALVIAATGGLATAHALPAPIQDAISRLGIGRPAHSHPSESDAPSLGGGAAPAAVGRSYPAPGGGSAVVGVPMGPAPGSRPATPVGPVPSTEAGGDPNRCAVRASHVPVAPGGSPTKTCSAPVPAPTSLPAPDPTTTAPTTSTPTTTSVSPTGASHAGGNGTSHAGGNGTSSAGGNGTSTAGGNGASHAGGNGKSNAGGNGKSNAGGNGKSNAGGNGKSNAGGNHTTKTAP